MDNPTVFHKVPGKNLTVRNSESVYQVVITYSGERYEAFVVAKTLHGAMRAAITKAKNRYILIFNDDIVAVKKLGPVNYFMRG